MPRIAGSFHLCTAFVERTVAARHRSVAWRDGISRHISVALSFLNLHAS
jgi:hypothetical protein